MKILYDHQIFERQKLGGISRYFYELMKNNSKNFDLSLSESDNSYLWNDKSLFPDVEFKDLHDKDYFKHKSFSGKNKINKYINQITNHKKNQEKYSIHKLGNSDFDLFHPTYYNDYFLPHIMNKPYVLTMYDLTHEMCPGYMNINSNKCIEFQNRQILCDKAKRIICISHNTKNDLINLYDIDEKKIDVVHLGNSLDRNLKQDFSLKEKLPSKYILFTGVRTIYKNFYFFLEAVKPLLINDPELKIVCTGYSFTCHEISFFKTLDLENKIIHFYAQNDNQMYTLYNSADLFIFPSLYEGFGLPVLEAFACECPTLLSNTSSLPEVGGDGASYFDPFSISSIRNTVEKVLNSQKLKEDLVKKGNIQLEKFSWKKTVEETLDVYKKAL